MAFSIEISEVGPAEYPLLDVLRDTVFGAFGHRSHNPIAAALADRPDLLTLIAHLEGNPVGFSAGGRRKPGTYYVNFLAILPEYRRQGLGRRLMERHEAAARAAGYKQIEFNTFNHFPSMPRVGLALGYRPVGVEQHARTDFDLQIRFGKPLQSPPRRQDVAEIERVQEALARGEQIVGVVRAEGGELQTLLRPAIQSRSQ